MVKNVRNFKIPFVTKIETLDDLVSFYGMRLSINKCFRGIHDWDDLIGNKFGFNPEELIVRRYIDEWVKNPNSLIKALGILSESELISIQLRSFKEVMNIPEDYRETLETNRFRDSDDLEYFYDWDTAWYKCYHGHYDDPWMFFPIVYQNIKAEKASRDERNNTDSSNMSQQ